MLDHVLMTICPSSAEQRGAPLRDTLARLSVNVGRVTIILADTLERWNLRRLGHDAAESSAMGLARGADWQRAYTGDLDRHLPGRVTILPWAALLDSPDYEGCARALRRVYDTPGPVQAEFDGRVDRYVARVMPRLAAQGKAPDEATMRWASREYLLEEYAGLAAIRATWDVPEVYPGDCIHDPDFLQRHNKDRTVDLTIPRVIPPADLPLSVPAPAFKAA